MPGTSVAIFTAIELEAKAVAAVLGIETPASGRPASGAVGQVQVWLHLVGIGAVGLESVEPATKPTWVIMAGIAGGLDPGLKIGDVVIDGDGAEMLGEVAGARRGTIHTAAEIASTPREKGVLLATTGAAAVDMESAIVRDWTRRHGARFIAIRGISDTASDVVDRDVLKLVDRWGRVRAGAVAALLVRRPWVAASLVRLGRDSGLAARRMADAMLQALGQIASRASDNRESSRG